MALVTGNGKALDFTNLDGLLAIRLIGNYSNISTSGFKTHTGGLFSSQVEVLGNFEVELGHIKSGTITNIILNQSPEGTLYSISGLNIAYDALLDALQNGGVSAARTLIFSGSDFIHGSDLGDVIFTYGGIDTVSAEGGDDLVDGGDRNDTLYGGDGNDRLYGGDDDDTLYGEDDNDILHGGYGADHLFGGKGNDYLDGSVGGDNLSGGTGDDVLVGGDGIDILRGDAGRDKLDGGRDNDMLDGGAGLDHINGGAGYDYLTYSTVKDPIKLKLDGSHYTDVLIDGVLADKVKNVEGVFGGKGDDRLTGDSAANSLYGRDGDDILKGGAGGDQLNGGAGDDIMTGGSGADHFRFETQMSLAGVDVITDFRVGVDTIYLSPLQFSVLPAVPVYSIDEVFAVGRAHDLNDYFIYKPNSGKFIYDPDGNGAGKGTVFALLDKHLDLTAEDLSF